MSAEPLSPSHAEKARMTGREDAKPAQDWLRPFATARFGDRF
jgi:hypothetical protein